MLLPKDKDPMGAAIADYHRTGRASTLRVFSSQFDEDEIPVDTLFRTLADMPSIEQRALAMARGKILDVGAGSGCHALALQKMGKEVTAIDISELSVEVMQERGVEDARAIDLYDERMTTMQAYRFLGETGTFGKRRKEAVDTLSAEIILQNYIDREKK